MSIPPLRFPTRRTVADDVDALAHAPSGGRGTQIFAGIILALAPIAYGLFCLDRGWASLFGSHASAVILRGSEAQALAAAYISLGLFCHFHWFWGLHPRLQPCSQVLKKLALAGFLIPMLWVIWQVVSWSFPV